MSDKKFTPELIVEIEKLLDDNYSKALKNLTVVEPYLKEAVSKELKRINDLWTEFRNKTV